MELLNHYSAKFSVLLVSTAQQVKTRFKDFGKEEDGASDIIVLIIIIGLVLAIALVFRKQIWGLVENLWNTIVVNPDPTTAPVINQWGN